MSARKYVAFARIAARQAHRDRGELYGRMAFFAVVLGVFASLWRATREAGLGMAADPSRLVWYLAGTEWILLSAPLVYVDVQEAIRRGDVACDLARPVSYVGAVLSQGLGQAAARAPWLAATAFVCAFAFTGWVPSAASLAAIAGFGSIAVALLTACHVAIGLLAFWLEDVTPLFWVWQKLLFVFGGLMLPIRLYPAFMQRIGALTPFPVLLAEPASFVLDANAVEPAALGLRLAVWCAVAGITLQALFARARRVLTVNGG